MDSKTLLGSNDATIRAYVVLLRETLRLLVDGIRLPDRASAVLVESKLLSLTWRVEEAERVLEMETGRYAEQESRIQSELASAGYTLADYVFPLLYGRARSSSGGIPSRDEVDAALQNIARMTEESHALYAITRVGTGAREYEDATDTEQEKERKDS